MTTWAIMGRRCEISRPATAFAPLAAASTRGACPARRPVDRRDAARLPRSAARSGGRGCDPVLIVGMPRSGSTLTEQILSSHPDVAAGGELEFWGARHRRARHLGHRRHRGGDAAPRRRLSGDAAGVRAGREAGHRQGARQFHAARRHPPRLPQRDPHPLPAPSDRHRSFHLHHEFRDELRLASDEATSCSSSGSTSG